MYFIWNFRALTTLLDVIYTQLPTETILQKNIEFINSYPDKLFQSGGPRIECVRETESLVCAL